MGYGSAHSLSAALLVANTNEVKDLLRAHDGEVCQVVVTCPRPTEEPIPNVVHQVWIGPRPPPMEWIDTWRVQHLAGRPEWEHQLWRDDDVAAILPESLRRVYATLPQLCFKADIARYAILEQYGGVYIDADMAWLGRAGLDSLTVGRDVLLAHESIPAEGFGIDERIGNSVIGVPPRHPLMSHVMQGIACDFAALVDFLGDNSPFLHEYKIGYRLTSPPALTHAYHALDMDMCALVPSGVFYPLPWWRGQSLSVSLEDTRIKFPSAVSTHYGYSTNRLGEDSRTTTTLPVQQSEPDVPRKAPSPRADVAPAFGS